MLVPRAIPWNEYSASVPSTTFFSNGPLLRALWHWVYRVFPAMLLITSLACGGCGETNKPPPARNMEKTGGENPKPFKNYVETGDLEALKKHGVLRIVSLAADDDDLLPRATIVGQRHFNLARKLARRLELEPRWFAASTPEQALRMLAEGRADLLAGNLTKTDQRAKQFDLTVPIRKTRQQLVSGRHGPDVTKPDALKDIELVVMTESVFIPTAEALAAKIPNAKVRPRRLSRADTIDRLIDGLNKNPRLVTVLDSNIVDGVLSYRQDIKAGAFVSDDEDIVWAMRKGSSDLRKHINNFLTRNLIEEPTERGSDWSSIKKSGVIRFLTYNGPTSYFMWKGELMGFDFDLAQAFANEHNLDLELVVVPHDDELSEWLKAGKGDFAGAGITATPEREAKGIVFSHPLTQDREQVISNSQKPEIKTVADLNGRTLLLRKYSSFVQTAQKLKAKGISVTVKIADPDTSYERIINMVAAGRADATIVDGSTAEIETSLRDTLAPGPKLTEPRPQGWMVTSGNESLLGRINNFIDAYKKTDAFAQKVEQYLKPSPQLATLHKESLVPGKPLSPYDKRVKKIAQKYEFDWRLIVAQMWQESGFDPNAESQVGAQGLLQVMPKTAIEMGYLPPLFDPEKGLQAGVKYLDWVRNRFEPGISLENQLWFSLAAYNAGIGHLYDAQRLAEKLNLDANVWFGNVEEAMLKLSEPRYFKNARYGYVRGSEPVNYVSRISRLYRAYTDISSGDVTRLTPPPISQPGLDASKSAPAISPRLSAQFCQYAGSTPSIGALLRRLLAERWRQSEGLPCPRQSLATSAPPDPGQSGLSPPEAVASGWPRSESGASASPATY